MDNINKQINWHALTLSEVFLKLNSSPDGTNEENLHQLFKLYGKNELPKKKEESIFSIFFHQINNLLNYVLIVASIFSIITKHWIDFWVIALILLANTSIGIYHKLKAKKVTNSLSDRFQSDCIVLRDGKTQKISTRDLVPGDVITLKNGDRIPADVRFIEAHRVSCVESSLTGESKSVEKNTGEVEVKTPLAEQRNMGFAGTIMVTGESKAIVVNTGTRTIIGSIALSLQSIKEGKTLFERRTEKLAKQMVTITFTMSSLIFLIGLYRGIDITELIQFVLATLISGIPEVLPTVLIIVLSIAALRMSQRKALLKKLSAIESLSTITTIITDKTGTLTENTMSVQTVILPDFRTINITGSSWNPTGDFFLSKEGKDVDFTPLEDPIFSKLVMLGGFNDQADVIKNKNHWENIGDPTEASRVVLSRKAGISSEEIINNYTLLHNIPYDQDTKYRQNIIKENNSGEIFLVLVGGAEKIIERVNAPLETIKKYQSLVADYARQTFRMQAVAYAKLKLSLEEIEQIQANELSENEILELSTMQQKMTLLGILAIQDPIRADIFEAVKKAQSAGVRVIMATGDHPATAQAIGIKTGILKIDESELCLKDNSFFGVLTDQQLTAMSNDELIEALKTITVFARVTPASKLRIAELLQKEGEVIAMTGDGTNDAPALKKADVGIAMGRIGTDAAREASDLIILDDNFSTIVSAIEEGRTVFRNVRQTSLFLLTTNFAEGLVMFISMLMGFSLPLLPLQILWLNLVTDGFSGIALATEKPQKTTLLSLPRKKKDGILNKKNLIFILTIAFIMMVGTILTFSWWMNTDLVLARTYAFIFLVFANLFNMINLRSLDIPITQLGFFSNKSINISFSLSCLLVGIILFVPFLREIFQFAVTSPATIGFLFILSSSIFFSGELLKKAHTID